jgi:NADH-quinone oxidoreductase subunit C
MAATGRSESSPSTQTVPGQTPQAEPVAAPPPVYPENVQKLLDRFPECWVPDWRFADGIPTAAVKPEQIVEIVRWLRFESTPQFDVLVDVAGNHWPEREFPFEVTYILHSLESNARIRLKCSAGGEEPAIPSLTGVWPAANWPEREIYDMFGVTFEGHPDLRRILMPEDWEGHPLRKDFPLGEEPIEFYRQPVGPSITMPGGGDINPTIP